MKHQQGKVSRVKQVESIGIRETEADFATYVEDLWHIYQWQVAHFRPGMTSRIYVNRKGEVKPVWVTPVGCDGKGYPDYSAVGPELRGYRRHMMVEIKSETGTVSPEQAGWLDLFSCVEGTEVYLFRPSDRPEIEQIILLGHVPNGIERLEFKSSWINRREENELGRC